MHYSEWTYALWTLQLCGSGWFASVTWQCIRCYYLAGFCSAINIPIWNSIPIWNGILSVVGLKQVLDYSIYMYSIYTVVLPEYSRNMDIFGMNEELTWLMCKQNTLNILFKIYIIPPCKCPPWCPRSHLHVYWDFWKRFGFGIGYIPLIGLNVPVTMEFVICLQVNR